VPFDRDELLARTDLALLADELLGGRRGNGRAARWPSPVPGHPQTGASPPMSIFRDRRGIERWTCFATGTAGTAIDLAMVARDLSAAEAMTWLAERAAMRGDDWRPRMAPVRPAARPAGPSDALRQYADACAATLWQPAGAAIRRWLTDDRCLDPDVLRRNRIGADPGRLTLRRARGLPWRGPGAAFPALDGHGDTVYVQLRHLHTPPGRPKYENPTAEHGTNPRVTFVSPAEHDGRGVLVVAEGMPDALTAASAGFAAAAVLGAGAPNAAPSRRRSSSRSTPMPPASTGPPGSPPCSAIAT
jgi:hypothetical protein